MVSLNSAIDRLAKAAAGCLLQLFFLELQYASKGLRCRHYQGHESRCLLEDMHWEKVESGHQEYFSGHAVLLD